MSTLITQESRYDPPINGKCHVCGHSWEKEIDLLFGGLARCSNPTCAGSMIVTPYIPECGCHNQPCKHTWGKNGKLNLKNFDKK